MIQKKNKEEEKKMEIIIHYVDAQGNTHYGKRENCIENDLGEIECRDDDLISLSEEMYKKSRMQHIKDINDLYTESDDNFPKHKDFYFHQSVSSKPERTKTPVVSLDADIDEDFYPGKNALQQWFSGKSKERNLLPHEIWQI